MRIPLITATLLFSSAAFGQLGQAVQVQVQSATGTDTLSVGPDLCGQQRTFSWTVTGAACAELSLWLTADTDCRDSASAQTGATNSLPSISLNAISQQGGTGTTSFDVSALPIFSSGDGGVTCGVTGVEQTVRLCAATKQSTDYLGTCNTVVKATSPLRITYDTQAPTAPSIASVAALDRALRVSVNAPADADEVRVAVSRDGTVVGDVTQGVAAGPIRVENLENDVVYQVTAYAQDAANNESAPSAVVEASPTRTLGFYEKYSEAQGTEDGGCGATGGGMAGGAVLAVVGYWLFSRRNRSWLEQ